MYAVFNVVVKFINIGQILLHIGLIQHWQIASRYALRSDVIFCLNSVPKRFKQFPPGSMLGRISVLFLLNYEIAFMG